ncbi:MAG: hypothetical protein IH899_18055 [Planctomycetes bacterium]|nr:hypothetical protein [Planctomycetota bacterium]
MLQPQERLSEEDLGLLIENMNRRLNLFGLSDVTVRDASDFSGVQYIMVEVAGVNENEVKDLISKQGKFEATVGNVSVFKGPDVIDVCRSATCSGIDFQAGGCQQLAPADWVCPFFFSITLSREAAQKPAMYPPSGRLGSCNAPGTASPGLADQAGEISRKLPEPVDEGYAK